MNLVRLAAGVVLLYLSLRVATADLLYDGILALSGTGIGTVRPQLTFSNNGIARGCVGWTGVLDIYGRDTLAACDVAGLSADGGTSGHHENRSQSVSIALADVPRAGGATGITRASQLRIVFNPNEGGGANNGIAIDDLILKVYSADGALLWHSSLAGAFTPDTYSETDVGTGGSGFMYKIPYEDLASAQPFFTVSTNRLAVQSQASQANSGNEVIFLTDNTFLGEAETPEAGTLLLVGTGALALGLYRRSRSRANTG